MILNLCQTTLNYIKLQELNQFLQSKSTPFLILAQVSPVFTVGLRCLNNNHIKNGLDLPIIKTNRGGQVTFHGPGQLMVYPVISLRDEQLKVGEYISLLEEIVIDACARVHVLGIRTCDTGVWVNNSKVASIGIHVSKDLKYFDQIVPCGLDKKMTSLSKELKRNVTPLEMSTFVIDACTRLFKQDFNRNDPEIMKEIERIIS